MRRNTVLKGLKINTLGKTVKQLKTFIKDRIQQKVIPDVDLRISSHTARGSFCTNEYLAGRPSDLIMSISGHKSEKSFRKYIKADQIKKASMIKELWDTQPSL